MRLRSLALKLSDAWGNLPSAKEFSQALGVGNFFADASTEGKFGASMQSAFGLKGPVEAR